MGIRPVSNVVPISQVLTISNTTSFYLKWFCFWKYLKNKPNVTKSCDYQENAICDQGRGKEMALDP